MLISRLIINVLARLTLCSEICCLVGSPFVEASRKTAKRKIEVAFRACLSLVAVWVEKFMVGRMRVNCNYFKVLDAIVEFVSILMMYLLRISKRSFDVFFHDSAVSPNHFAIYSNTMIAVAVYVSLAFFVTDKFLWMAITLPSLVVLAAPPTTVYGWLLTGFYKAFSHTDYNLAYWSRHVKSF